MANAEPAIFTNMCMICDGHGNILVQDRRNPDWPGITFPGGHVEPGESFAASVIREVFEETGLTIENPVLCGVKQFQNRTGPTASAENSGPPTRARSSGSPGRP